MKLLIKTFKEKPTNRAQQRKELTFGSRHENFLTLFPYFVELL